MRCDAEDDDDDAAEEEIPIVINLLRLCRVLTYARVINLFFMHRFFILSIFWGSPLVSLTVEKQLKGAKQKLRRTR